MSERSWPFEDPKSLAVFTTRHVTEGTHPIARVFRDASDGTWQFLPDLEIKTEDAQLVSLENMVKGDPSLGSLADLPIGFEASRASPNVPWSRAPTYPLDWEIFVQEAYQYTTQRQEEATATFDLGRHERWDYDQPTAAFRFSSGGTVYVSANMRIVGSFSTASNSWMWSWANSSLHEAACEGMFRLRQLGEVYGFSRLTEALIEDAEEVDAWENSAVACHIFEAEAVYRAPTASGFLFVLLEDIAFSEDPED